MSAMQEEPEPDEPDWDEIAYIVAHEQMADETLIKHLNARHLPIKGVPALPEGQWNEHAEPFSLWREWHAAVHRLAVPYNVVNGHVHESEERQ